MNGHGGHGGSGSSGSSGSKGSSGGGSKAKSGGSSAPMMEKPMVPKVSTKAAKVPKALSMDMSLEEMAEMMAKKIMGEKKMKMMGGMGALYGVPEAGEAPKKKTGGTSGGGHKH
jgi:hypothetical protein